MKKLRDDLRCKADLSRVGCKRLDKADCSVLNEQHSV